MSDHSENKVSHREDYVPMQVDDVFLDNPALDNVTSAVIALGSEFWALQTRMNVMETLLEENGSITKEMIENHRPTQDQRAALDEQRDRFIKRVYGFLANTETSDTPAGKPAETTAG